MCHENMQLKFEFDCSGIILDGVMPLGLIKLK